jgi:cytoskeletal protein CcmA (bactofilin family)/DNA-directed RNA polymerase subunit RPC12/RpoP
LHRATILNAGEKVLLACPYCGHRQSEPRAVISTFCRSCGRHIRAQEILRPEPKLAEPIRASRRVSCFDCGAELEVSASAESTMCKRCSRYVDLKDYRIANAVSKNFKTKGAFVVEQKGYVFNTEAIVGDATIKGRFLGKLFADQLAIYSSAEIKGSFKANRLCIPAGNHFRWSQPIDMGSAEIAGELVAELHATGTVVLRPTARLFGNIHAAHLVVESGAVIVGAMRIGSRAMNSAGI